MSEAITVTCPSCKATLKLKNRNSVGKKVPCPKCKKPYVVKAPQADEEDDMAFLNASESDAAVPMAEEEEDEFAAALPARPTSKASPGKSKKGKRKSSDTNWVKPLLLGAAALVVVGLLVGGGVVAVSMLGGQVQNKIDLTYLPPDADVVVHVRVDEVLGSPFVQPLLANANVKTILDQIASEYHVAHGDVKSMTMGIAGLSGIDFSKIAVPGMGAPGIARPGAGTGIEKTRAVVVIRTSKPLDAEKVTKIDGYAPVEHQGQKYFRAAVMNPAAPKPVVFLAAADVLLVADEAEVQRIIEKGHKQTRRPEFDFLETSPQILIAIVNKNNLAPATPAAAGAPGMPGTPGTAPAGGANGLASLSNGKVPAWYIGITCTQDIEIQAGFSSPGATPEVQADLEKFVAKQKSDFEAAKKTQLAMLPLLGLGDLIPQLEATVNSFRVSGNGSVAQLNAKIPGAIKGSIEKGMTAMAGMAGAGPGGLGGPNPFGGQAPVGPPGQSPPSTGGDGAPSSSSSNPATAPQQPVP